MKPYIKRFFIFGLSAILVIAPAAAYANTSIGGWTAVDAVIAGANTTINAAKGAGSSAVKSAITIAPQAGKVGKVLLRGGFMGALLLAVPQVIGDGVDWVLDPENNAIKVTRPSSPTGLLWSVNSSPPYVHPTAQAAGAVLCQAIGQSFVKLRGYSAGATSGGSYVDCSSSTGHAIQARVGETPATTEYVPIEQIAAQVISNAAAGNPESQEAVKAAALEGFVAGEYDAALDAASEPDVGTDNPPDTTDPENPPAPTDPAVPFDPSSIIAAINALKAMLAGIMSSITGLSDFVQSSPETPTESTDVVVDAPIDDFETDKNYITFSGSCPPNYSASLSIMGNTVPFSFDYAPICTVMAALKPFIVGAGYLTAAYIIAGYSRGTNG